MTLQIRKRLSRLGNEFVKWHGPVADRQTILRIGMPVLPARKRFCKFGNRFAKRQRHLRIGKRFCKSACPASESANDFADRHGPFADREIGLRISKASFVVRASFKHCVSPSTRMRWYGSI